MARSARIWLSSSLVIVVSAMTAALALGYYSYRSSAQLAAMSATSVERANRALGRKLIDRIEKVIIDGDRTFFRLVNLDDPREFSELWRRIIRISPAVESVVVLDQERNVSHLIAKLSRRARRGFRKILEQSIVPDMQLSELLVDKHRHLHKRYRGHYYLLSYIRRRSADRDYYIILNVNIPYLIRTIFREEFLELAETTSIAVRDERGRVLYGSPIETPNRLIFEDRFPTTLYKWRLQVAPRQATTLSRGARKLRVSDLIFLTSAVGIIWLGLIFFLVAMRKERRANALKSDFVANVSHELKTPLSLIRMFGELLSLGQVGDGKTRQEYAGIILRESDRLTSLIDNMLDFARIEGGKAAYEMVRCDVREVVEKVADLSRHRAEQAGVTIHTELPDTPIEAFHDPSAMILALLNLVENALKYGSSGGKIGLGALERGEDVSLWVEDRGPGIDESESKLIFDRFYRGSAARRGAARGSGIGLSLVQNVALAHGGEARVESRSGIGARFEIVFPVRTIE